MTPLAQRIVRELTLPLKARTFDDRKSLLPRMGDIHCFEISKVGDAVDEMAEALSLKGVKPDGRFGEKQVFSDARVAFLPAPKTWIEWSIDNGRVGMLLDAKNGETSAVVTVAMSNGPDFWSATNFLLYLGASEKFGEIALSSNSVENGITRQWLINWQFFLYVALAFINTPKIVGRSTAPAHRGLEKALRKAETWRGKFPLKPWTEITLRIDPEEGAAGDGSERLTGQRALHFCRSYLRFKGGKLEIVSAHWRGDGALGITRSTYKVTGGGAHA